MQQRAKTALGSLRVFFSFKKRLWVLSRVAKRTRCSLLSRSALFASSSTNPTVRESLARILNDTNTTPGKRNHRFPAQTGCLRCHYYPARLNARIEFNNWLTFARTGVFSFSTKKKPAVWRKDTRRFRQLLPPHATKKHIKYIGAFAAIRVCA